MAAPDSTPAINPSAPPPNGKEERRRIEALRAYGILDTEPDPAFDEIARLAAAICRTPIALVSFIDETRQWFKAHVGLDEAETPRALSFCAHTVGQRDIFTVPDARQDARFADNPLVGGGPLFRFYAGVPLISLDGHGLGTLCVIDREARPGLVEPQEVALRVLGRAVMAQLELRRRATFVPPPKTFEITAVLERVSDAIVALNGEWRYTFLNAQAGRLFGRHPHDLIGKHIWTEFPDGVGQKFHLAYQKALEDQRPASIEEYYPPFDRWFENRIYPSPDGLTIYFHDITARKQAELLLTGQVQVLEAISKGVALAVSLALLVRLIENQSEGLLGSVLLLDPDGMHLRHGAAPSLPEEYVRMIDGAMIGPRAGSCGTAAYLREPVFVEDIAVDPRWENWRGLAVRHGLLACWSMPIFDAQRQVLGTFAIYYRRVAQPTPRHLELIATATHIAAIAIGQHRHQAKLREQTEVLHLALKGAGLGAWRWNLQTDAATQIHEGGPFSSVHDSAYPATGEAVRALIHPDDRGLVAEKVRLACEQGQPYRVEFRLVEPGREDRWISSQGQLEHDANGRPEILGVDMDITDRKRAEAEFRQVSEQRRALAVHLQFVREEERTRIAREIHDVLAQDLTRVKIDLAWLARRVGRPIAVVKRPEMVARLAETLAQTDAAITTVQKIATELRPVILDRLGLAAAIEWLVEDFARRTGIAGRARIDPGIPAIEPARATAFFRIVQESLTNIVRYSRASSVEIDLVTEFGALSLTIRDNGVGISAAQVDDKLSIGLIGMRERAMAFGGSVEISGIPDRGTTILVRIPAGER